LTVVDLVANEVWAGGDAEAEIFAANQICQSVMVEFLELREVQHGPQLALCGGLDELFQIFEMSQE
jgi:hypothetical protein